MRKKKVIRACIFVTALVMTAVSIFELLEVKNTGAAVIKNGNQATSSSSLQPVTYNGENMYVAKSSYYDYYADVQVGTGATPLPITDAYIGGKNAFVKFNVRLMEVMKYNVPSECPAKYPMYQGRQYEGLSDFGQIYQKDNDRVNENSNYWVGANHSQIGAYAIQGLVDNKLAYDSEGNSHMVQSNPANGKSGFVPYFNKKVLTQNKFEGSELTLGNVKENVSFPFRREVEDGVTYYEFDSAVDTVRFNASNQLDYLGKNNQAEMVKDRLGVGGLFPENVAADSNSNKLNFAYGFKIEVPFNMTSDGKINGKDMVFEFSGDDDVWVFIDDILALDMGGAHPKITGSINFATGKTVVQGVRNPKVSFATRSMRSYGTGIINMPALGLVNEPAVYNNYTQSLSNELKAKLANTSEVHTLTLFYMERGMDVSNMKMKFNLPEPTKLDVSNKLDFSNVGETFAEETKKVANKDSFTYDVVDKTKSTRAEIDMKDGESVTFLNEFAAKDILLVQESGLKSETRKLTELYSTSWILKDLEAEIAKDNSLVVKDPRRTDKTMVFSNKNNDDTPVMNVLYTNKP